MSGKWLPMHMHGGEVGVDRAAKCPAQNRVSQKHTRFRRLTRNQKPVEVNVKKMHSRIYKSITSQ